MAIFNANNANLRRSHNWRATGTTFGTNRVGATFYAVFEGAAPTASVNADGARVVGWQINDRPFQYQTLASGANTVTLATGLPAGQHRLRFFYDGRGASSATDRWTAADITLNSFDFDNLLPLPTPAPTRNLFVFGDSIMESVRDVGINTHANSPVMAMTEALNNTYQVSTFSFGGTGYLSTGASGLQPLSGTWEFAWSGNGFTNRPGPDAVLITMGTNDSAATDAALTAAVSSTISAMQTAWPGALFFVQIPIGGTKRAAIAAGVQAIANRNLKLIDCGTFFERGLTVGADTYYSSDQVHPTAIALQAYTSRTLFDIASGIPNAQVSTDSIAAITAAVWGASQATAIATTTQLDAARDAVIARGDVAWITGTGGSGGFAENDRTTLNNLATRASEARLVNLETVAREATANNYKADVSALATPANVWAHTTRTLTAAGTLTPAERTAVGTAVWANTTRSLTAAVTTDAASRTASQNDLSAIATTAQLITARDAIIARGDVAWITGGEFTESDRTALTGLSSRASEARLVNLETVARDATAATYRATGFATPANVSAVTTAVNAARDAVIARGDVAWITGTGGSGGGGFTESDRTTLTGLSDRASEARLVKLDTVATAATAATYRATGFATPANVSAVTTAVNAARDAVIARGDVAWITATGFATVNPDNLTLSRLGGLLTGDFSRFTAVALANAPTGGGSGGSSGSGLTPEQSQHLLAIPTNPLLANNYVAPNNTGINEAVVAATAAAAAASTAATTISSRLTESRAAKLDTVATLANASAFKADVSGLATTSQLSAIATTAQLNTARDAIIARGDVAWVTGAPSFTATDRTRLNSLPTTTPATVTQVNAARDAIIARGDVAWITGTGGFTTTDRTRLNSLPTSAATPQDIDAAETTILQSLTLVGGGVSSLLNRLTDGRAAKLDTVATLANSSDFKADLSAIATTTQVNAARDAIINRGNTAWTTGIAATPPTPPTADAIATAVDNRLTGRLTAIAADAKGARQAALNNVFIDKALATVTIIDDDDLTPLFRFQMLNALGNPSLIDSVSRVREIIEG